MRYRNLHYYYDKDEDDDNDDDADACYHRHFHYYHPANNCGVYGNETAARLAKEGGCLEQDKQVSHNNNNIIITNISRAPDPISFSPELLALYNEFQLQYIYNNEKTIIKTLTEKNKWRQQHPDHNRSDSETLTRAGQVILFRLRTGHNRMRAAHLYNTNEDWPDGDNNNNNNNYNMYMAP